MKKLLSKGDIELLEKRYGDKIETALLSEELNQYIYSKGFYDIGFFTDYHLMHWKVNKDTGEFIPTPDFHYEIWDALKNKKRTCIIIPRDHAKSTSAKMFLIWSICYRFDKSILLFMPEKLGVQTIGDIRNEFEKNVSINEIFGRLAPGRTASEKKKWKDNILQFNNGVQIQSVVKKGQVRGLRPSFLLVDDPQELEDVMNELQAKRFSFRFWSAVYGTLQPTGRCAVLGTVISENCLVNEIAKEKPSFYLIKKKAISRIKKAAGRIVGGQPLWADLWPVEALEERRQDVGDDIFNQEYQNMAHSFNHRPVLTKNVTMNVVLPVREIDDIQFFIDYVHEDLVFGIDTAEGHETSDYSTIVGRTRSGQLAVQYQGKVPEDILAQKMDKIFDMGYRGIVAPERNKGTLFIATCKNYWWFDDFIYQQVEEETDREAQSAHYGWHTNVKTKKIMIGEYDVILRYCSEKAKGNPISDALIAKWNVQANISGIVDWEMSPELKTEKEKYVYDEKGGANAMPGYNDDLLIADMICNQARKMASPIASVASLESLGF